MSKFRRNEYQKGRFKMLDNMNEKPIKTWFSHKLNKIIYEVYFSPGTGATYLEYIENEFDDENVDAKSTWGNVINEYL